MRIYAELPDGKKFLYSLHCDGVGCDAEIKPDPKVSSSGWMRCGTDHGVVCWIRSGGLEVLG